MSKGIYKHKKLSEETKRKIGLSQPWYGKKRIYSTCLKISQKRKERKEKLGYINSPETRLKMSNSLKGKHFSPKTEFKKGIIPWNTGTSSPEKRKSTKISATLKYKYGISIEEYNIILNSQNGVCKICKRIETKKSRTGDVCKLHIDHDHKTGKIRGLLCHKCNVAISLFCDDTSIMKKAIIYLDENK